jgi:hypothetical protein
MAVPHICIFESDLWMSYILTLTLTPTHRGHHAQGVRVAGRWRHQCAVRLPRRGVPCQPVNGLNSWFGGLMGSNDGFY